MKVAIVHDWLVTWRGGEKVLESIASIYPDAPIYTLFCDFSILPESLRHRKIIVHPTANRFKFMRKALLPLMPIWMESFDMSGFDLIVSTSSCVAKGVIPDPGAKHLCYMHSPMRYVWDQRDEYLGRMRRIPIVGFLVDFLSSMLRIWDTSSASRVDLFIANSNFVRQRIRKYYGRNALVIHPPVDVARFKGSSPPLKKDYFLAAGALVSYKRFDLAIAACESLGVPLIIAGQGPELDHLRTLAGPHTTFEVAPDNERWVQLMREAQGLLFCGVEDFGITAIEAMAAGTPVVARQLGGALDFVIEGKTGVFFQVGTVESLRQAILDCRKHPWDVGFLEQFATKFDANHFKQRLRITIDELNEPDLQDS